MSTQVSNIPACGNGRIVDRYRIRLFDGREFDVYHRTNVDQRWVEVRAEDAECRVFIERDGNGFFTYDYFGPIDRATDGTTLFRQLLFAMNSAQRRMA